MADDLERLRRAMTRTALPPDVVVGSDGETYRTEDLDWDPLSDMGTVLPAARGAMLARAGWGAAREGAPVDTRPEPQSWSLWLPFPLSSNNLFAHRVVPGRGRVYAQRYPTSAYRRWRREAEVRILASRIPRMTEPVVIKLELTPPNNRRRDCDNFGKGILDALVAARVLPDDNMQWVKSVIPYWRDAHKPTAGVVVTLRIAQLELFKAAEAHP